MQSEVYKRKPGFPKRSSCNMMADTTYMTGREAIEKGFADELIEDAEPVGIAASAMGAACSCAAKQFHLLRACLPRTTSYGRFRGSPG